MFCSGMLGFTGACLCTLNLAGKSKSNHSACMDLSVWLYEAHELKAQVKAMVSQPHKAINGRYISQSLLYLAPPMDLIAGGL